MGGSVLITVIVVLVLLGLILWGVMQLPLDPTIKVIIRVVAVVGAVLYLLRVFGLMRGLP